MNEPLLRCSGLCKSFGAKAALDGVDLSLERGRIIGLLGPNGSGKTTFIKLANGLLTPSRGELLINGEKPGPRTKAAVSYLPDADYLPDWMTVRNLVNMFADFYPDFSTDKAVQMLISLSINGAYRLKSLSRGNREKVQLVLAMSRKAQLYLLDEPIGGVDPAARDYILRTILQNYSEDSTILLSTHLISDIEQILDEAIFIQNGHILMHRTVDEIRAQEGKSVDEYFREVFKC